MRRSAGDQSLLDTAVAGAVRTLGEELVAAAIYGEATTAAYRPGRTAMNVVLLVGRSDLALLDRLRRAVAAWPSRRIPTPLVFDQEWLASSQDAFPLELLEIADHHELLHGDADPFRIPDCPYQSWRREVEEQLKGNLRGQYLAVGDSIHELANLIRDSLVGFDIVLRALCFLLDPEADREGEGTLLSLERLCNVELAALRALQATRLGSGAAVAPREVRDTFAAYERELATLARVVDGL